MKTIVEYLINNHINKTSDKEELLCEAIEWLKKQTNFKGNSGVQDKDVWEACTNKVVMAFDLDKTFDIDINTIYAMFDVDSTHSNWNIYMRYLDGISDKPLVGITYIPDLKSRYKIWEDDVPEAEKGNEFLSIMASSKEGDTCVEELFGKQAHRYNPHNTGVTGYYVNYTKFKK